MKLARGARRALVPLAGGLLVAASLPPLGLWPLAFVGMALFARSLRSAGPGRRAVSGLAFGLGQFAVGLSWAMKFTFVGYLALVVVEAALLALAALCVAPGRGRIATFAGALTLAEWLRQSWPFGGLPLGGLALGQVGGPLGAAARLGGGLLLVGLTCLAGAGLGELADLFAPAGRARPSSSTVAWRVVVPLLCTVAVGLCAVVAPSGGAPTRTISVAVVQGGGRRGFSQLQVPPSVVYAAAVRETGRLRGRFDLVLWPEDVVALDGPLAGSAQSAQLSAIARRLRTTLVVGVTEPVGTTQFRNEVVAYGPSGRIVATFEKVHRVPFGEYVPYRSFFARFANLSAVPRDAIAGTGSGMISTPAGRLAVLVSFEVFFAARGRSGVQAGGQLIIVPTNTSSYSSQQAPAQEIAASRLQAISFGRDLLQAAPTGYSAVIDNDGDVLQQTALSSPSVLTATVALRDGETIYLRTGDLVVLALAAASLLAGWVVELARRRRRPASPPPT